MKLKAKISLFLALCWLNFGIILAQETFYVYRTDGTVNQFLISEVMSIEASQQAIDGVWHEDYVTQEIHLQDSVLRIPISEVDSVAFSAPDPIQSISDAYVEIDWEQASVIVFNPNEGKYQFSYTGEDPEVHEGSVVIIDSDSISVIVLVTGVIKNGNVYDIEGEQGDLGYIFSSTEFTLTTENQPTLTRYLYRPAPKKRDFSIDADENGTMRATGTLWKNNDEEQTDDLYKKDNTHIYTKRKFGLNLDYALTLRFGDKVESEKQGKRFLHAKDIEADVKIIGNMNAYYDYYIDIKGEKEFDLAPGKDKYVLLKHKLFPTIPLKFAVGPVPVTVDLGCDLFADVSLKGKGEFHFTTGIGADASATFGIKYDGRSNNRIRAYHEKPTLNITPHMPTISGKGELSGKLHVFPRVHAWLYGLAGPSIDLKPFLQADLSGGFQKSLLTSESSDYCAWSLKTYCGLDFAVGLSRSSWNYETWNESTDDLTLFKYELYNSPVDLKFGEAIPDKIAKDVPTDVSFIVYDKGFDGKPLPTPLPQLVKFEGNGNIESTVKQFGITSNGKVTATWTPTSNTDVLHCRIYDIDGNVIAEDHYGVDMCPDSNHPHLINLGLESGTLWSCSNLDASMPENYGGYYAYAELGEKNSYSEVNYQYYYYDWLSDDVDSYYTTIGEGLQNFGISISGKKGFDVVLEYFDDGRRMPTHEELQELVDNCEWTWSFRNNIPGYEVKGPNGNTIFLPAAGAKTQSSYYSGEPTRLTYYRSAEWSDQLWGTKGFGWTWGLKFKEGSYEVVKTCAKAFGYVIRPVKSKEE